MQKTFFNTPAPNPNLVLNPDGVSIKGCSIIYAPKGQAGEYSRLATNPYRGCGHGCAYCFCPSVLRMDRAEFNAGAIPRKNFLNNLIKDARKYQTIKSQEQVMLSFTTDPYHPGDTALTRDTLVALKEHGLSFCTLTKGGSRALRDLDLFRPERDAFASTLTSLDPDFSKKWEPNAALPEDRISTLLKFHRAGIFTWVSLEPVLDTEATLAIIERTHPYVDFFKIGRVNYSNLTKTTDWEKFTHDILDVVIRLGVKAYFKKDLQPYLPKDHVNVQNFQQSN